MKPPRITLIGVGLGGCLWGHLYFIGGLRSKKYKVLNISGVTLLGESQADHIGTKPKGDKK